MNKTPTLAELQYSARTLKQTSKDLIYKKLVPEHTLSYFTDKAMLKQATWNYSVEPTKTWGCPVCGLGIRCPKAWIIQHIKTHERRPTERKEGDIIENKVNPYRY